LSQSCHKNMLFSRYKLDICVPKNYAKFVEEINQLAIANFRCELVLGKEANIVFKINHAFKNPGEAMELVYSLRAFAKDVPFITETNYFELDENGRPQQRTVITSARIFNIDLGLVKNSLSVNCGKISRFITEAIKKDNERVSGNPQDIKLFTERTRGFSAYRTDGRDIAGAWRLRREAKKALEDERKRQEVKPEAPLREAKFKRRPERKFHTLPPQTHNLPDIRPTSGEGPSLG